MITPPPDGTAAAAVGRDTFMLELFGY